MHWHTSIEDVLIYGVSAIVVINLSRLAAGNLAKRNGKIGELGKAFGAIVA